jgi:FkbM family methyltransferase
MLLRRGMTYVKEFARCARHNLLHLRVFGISYGGGLWRARDRDVSMVFPYYPYLAFYEIEGYLNQGRWRPQPGMTVIDAGGCFGEFSIYASKCVGPRGRVLILEPDPQNIERAKEVFRLNGNPSNIEIVPAGLWKQRGTVRFRAGHGSDSAIDSDAAPDAASGRATGGDVIEIPTHSLASLTSEYKLDRIDLVKMDIEGAELDAVAGVADLPPNLRPRFAIASYHVVAGRRTADALAEIFPGLGFHCRTGYPDHLTTWAAPLAVPID